METKLEITKFEYLEELKKKLELQEMNKVFLEIQSLDISQEDKYHMWYNYCLRKAKQ